MLNQPARKHFTGPSCLIPFEKYNVVSDKETHTAKQVHPPTACVKTLTVAIGNLHE